MARIFAGNDVSFSQHAQSAQGYVFEIAYRRCYNVKRSWHDDAPRKR